MLFGYKTSNISKAVLLEFQNRFHDRDKWVFLRDVGSSCGLENIFPSALKFKQLTGHRDAPILLNKN